MKLAVLVGTCLVGVAADFGQTTRYWDCCKPSCAWPGKTQLRRGPVQTCNSNNQQLNDNGDTQSGCNGGGSFMCSAQQPWAVNNNLAYGFAAVHLQGQSERDWCCACYQLTFTSGSVQGKTMVVQATNTGGELGNNHFDLQIPGGGVGIFNGCQTQWGAPSDGWGQRYGGINSQGQCSQLPWALQGGCNWRFNWFNNANNPSMSFQKVSCPKALTDISKCIRSDDNSSGSGGSWQTGANGAKWNMGCDFNEHNIGNQQSSGDQCSEVCRRRRNCNAFAWSNYNGGTCWMKSFSQVPTPVSSSGDSVCGYLPERF